MGDLLKAKNPTGEEMIRVFGCRSEVPMVFKAKADVFEEVLSKATVSRSEMQTMAAWAAHGLSHCAENGMPIPRDEFAKILTLCGQQLKKMEPASGTVGLQDLSGWRF
jgi:hypothetical protein